MACLIYLTVTQLKNKLKELVRHPGRLVLVILFLVLLAFSLLPALLSPPIFGFTRPREELHALVLALYAAVFIYGVSRGFSSGASFYSMADVGLLFQTPVSSRRILLYGLIKQMGIALYIGFFLLFQFAWVNQVYGLSLVGMVCILAGYGVILFCAQLTAMVIYAVTGGFDRARRVVMAGVYAVCVTFALLVLVPVLRDLSDPIAAAVRAADSVWVALFPVAGWVKHAVVGVMTGNMAALLPGLGATALYAWGLLFFFTRSHPDFYEDVLLATEVSFSAITAKKEGKMMDALPKNVKLGKTGIRAGRGAGVFYYKHQLEDRRGQFFIFDKTTFTFYVMFLVFCVIMRDSGALPLIILSVYLQLFTSAMGRWVRELLLPYVYLIPEPPFQKLLFLCSSHAKKTVLEAAVFFIPAGLIVGMSVPEIVACIAMRVGFGLLFMAGNILVEKLLGGLGSKTLIVMLYFLTMVVLCIPAIIVGLVIWFAFGGVLSLALWGTMICNTVLSAVLLFLCQNMLDCAEMNNR